MLLVQVLADARRYCEKREICKRDLKLKYLRTYEIHQLVNDNLSIYDYTKVSRISRYFLHDLSWMRFDSAELDYFRWVIENNKIKLLQSLIAKQFLTLRDVRNLFSHACYHGCLKILKIFLRLGFTIHDIRLNHNYELNQAIKGNQFKVVKLLIRSGLTVDDLRRHSNYALLIASIHGRFKIVKLLMKQGLSIVDIRSNNNLIVNKTTDERVFNFFIKQGLHPNEIPVTYQRIDAKLDVILKKMDMSMKSLDTCMKSLDKLYFEQITERVCKIEQQIIVLNKT